MSNARIFVDEAADLEKPQRESWQDAAVCASTDPEIFFPQTNGKGNYSQARKICKSCDVRLKCLSYILQIEGNLNRNLRFGMYAGLSPAEREKMSRDISNGVAEITGPIVKV